jgi:hypothetical protein
MKNTLIGAFISALFFTMNPLNADNEQINTSIPVSGQTNAPELSLAYSANEAIVQAAIPFLIPFNKALFDVYCCKQVKFYGAKRSYWPVWFAGFIIAMSSYALYDGFSKTREVFGNFKETITTSHGIKWAFGSCGYGGYCLFCLKNMMNITGTITEGAHFACEHVQRLFKRDYDALQNTWEAYMIAPMAEQEKQWHTIVYEKFGKPVVLSLANTHVAIPVNLVFRKENGAGCVSFDPYDKEQVEILLGMHEKKHDDLRCKELSIMPSFKQ